MLQEKEGSSICKKKGKNVNSFLFTILAVIPNLLLLMLGCNHFKIKDSEGNEHIVKENQQHNDSLKEIVFLPYWITNAQFAGYYMGVEKGIYKKYGISLKIHPYQPFITSTQLLKEGKVDFAAIWLANAIELKASGTDIVNIAQPSTQSSLMLITKKRSGISKLGDMNGKKAGIWEGYELQPQALFKKNNLDVKIIPIGSTNNLFLMDGVDITIANWFDEYHSLLSAGLNPDELNTFFFADYGLNFLEDGIYCMSSLLEKDSQLCADFIKATFEGWLYAFNNPEEAVAVVVKYSKALNLPANKVHQRWMLDRYKDLYNPDARKKINTMLHEKDYLSVGEILLENGLIDHIPPYKQFFIPVLK